MKIQPKLLKGDGTKTKGPWKSPVKYPCPRCGVFHLAYPQNCVNNVINFLERMKEYAIKFEKKEEKL